MKSKANNLRVFFGSTILFVFMVTNLSAFDPVTITSVSSSSLEGPIHHGLVVETNGIKDPNLSFYEVQIKPDTGGPFPPWQVYNTEVMPFDGKTINLPYRNGLLALLGDQTYCVKVRGVYGSTVTPWAQRCGVILEVPASSSGDTDGDGIPDAEEFARGIDPQDPDTDRDGIPDNTEIAEGSDPNEALYPNLILRTVSIDFGDGDPLGQKPNQHQYIEIENAGEEIARIDSVRVIGEEGVAFRVGSHPTFLSHIPPEDRVRISVSFIPLVRGAVSAQIEIVSNNPTPLDPVTVTGTGVEFPDCIVRPSDPGVDLIDFGTVSLTETDVVKQGVTISNNSTDAPFGFTLSATNEQMVPAVRGFVLLPGDQIEIPIIFRHSIPGDHQGHLEVRSITCGLQQVELRGRTE